MSDSQNDNRSSRPLSEISHLFLSSMREQAGGEHRVRPVRLPPGQRPVGPVPDRSMPPPATSSDVPPVDGAGERRKRVTAVIGGGTTGDAALAYAASLAADGARIGVMHVDDAEFRLQLVECDADVPASEPEVSDQFEPRQMHDVMLELNHEVDRWLLISGDHRRPEARALLARADDWTMLATCDHDGIVGGYRTLKGLAEAGKAPLSITLVDAADEDDARKAFAKLSGVCRQFLDWDVRLDALVPDVEHAQAHTLLWCHSGRDRAHLASGPQWRVANELLAMRPDDDADRAHFGQADGEAVAREPIAGPDHEPAGANQPMSIPPIARPTTPTLAETAPMSMPTTIPFPTLSAESPNAVHGSTAPRKRPSPCEESGHIDGLGEVIDLPDGVSVLSAVLRSGTQLLATPIAPPMCPGATVAVGRDRGLVLVAQAGAGLAGMDSIAAAVRWLDDSKQLIAMAMPQLAVDGAIATRVQLLIDHNDRAAEGIRPLLGDSRITIRSYRRLRWAGRNGLLLDAA